MYSDVVARLLPLLRYAGVDVATGTQRDLVLNLPGGGRSQVEVKPVRRRLSLRQAAGLVQAAGRRTLFVASSASSEVVEAAQADEFDLVTAEPERVVVGGQVLLQPERPTRAGDNGRPAWGRRAVQRVLALAPRPMQQAELAAAVGISQQAVSQALQWLSKSVEHAEGGWVARDGALGSWVRDYPGPGGAVGHWYGLDDPAAQASTALGLLDELELCAVVSGDLAADRYAPWQLPSTVHLYLPEIVDFTVVGFSPAEPADATMTTVIPEDPTVIHVAAAFEVGYDNHLLADAAITLWDLLNTSTVLTAGEAADRLRTAIEMGELGV